MEKEERERSSKILLSTFIQGGKKQNESKFEIIQ